MSKSIKHGSLVIVNPSDKDWTRHRYILALGAYGWTKLMIWANGLDSACEVAIEWCHDNAPGLLCTDAVNEEYQRVLTEALTAGLSEDSAHEKAAEEAETDTIQHDGDYILSYELHIVAEDPCRDLVLAMTRA